MQIKLVLWDWNGTMFDDVGETVEAYNRMFDDLGKYNKFLTKELYRSTFSSDIRDYYRFLGFDTTTEEFDYAAGLYLYYYDILSEKSELQQGLPDILDYFRRLGIKQDIVSASNKILVHKQVNRFPLNRFISNVVACKNYYAENKYDLMKETIEKEGVSPSDCLIIGDTVSDAKIARNLGTNCIMFTGGHQCENSLKNEFLMVGKLEDIAIKKFIK